MLNAPIHELLPHAGDMIFLDRVTVLESERIVAASTVRSDWLLCQQGALPAWAAIELMAQTVAAFAGGHARLAGEPVKLGFLLGTRRFTTNTDIIPAGTELTIEARCSLQDEGGMGVFECRLTADAILIEARLNVFSPRDPDAYLQDAIEESET